MFVGDPITLIVFAALFGLVDFATLVPTQLLATKLFRDGIGTVFGWLFMNHQLGSAVGAFVPGLVYDLTGGYLVSLSGAMTLLLIASVPSVSPLAGGVRQRGSSQPYGPRRETAWAATCRSWYCTAGPQFASSDFLADSKTQFIINGSQQQWLTRNSEIGKLPKFRFPASGSLIVAESERPLKAEKSREACKRPLSLPGYTDASRNRCVCIPLLSES